MVSEIMLFTILLLMLYLVFRDRQASTHLPAPVAQRGDPSGQEAHHTELRASHVSHPSTSLVRADQEGANSVPIGDTDQAAFEHSQVALHERIFAAGSSTSVGDHREQAIAVGASASQSNILPGHPAQTVLYSANPVASTASVSTLGPSFVNKFVGLRVNTTYSFLASGRATVTNGTPPSSPLSSPPSSPFLSSSMSSFETPMASRTRRGTSSNAVDFSLFAKKTRVVTKSPKKPQTQAAGKLSVPESASEVTTTWFHKISTEPQLLDTPPDLTGHPDGLALGDVYFDSVADQYQLWLWCLDDVGIPHWKKIPFGYEREDGKRLIVTRKIHLLSWVTTKYYKGLANDETLPAGMDVDED